MPWGGVPTSAFWALGRGGVYGALPFEVHGGEFVTT